MIPETRELTLKKGHHEECTLYKLKNNWNLRFKPGPDCLGEDVKLYTNYPEDGCEFDRNRYRQLKWNWLHEQDRASYFSELNPTLPGSFRFYFSVNDESSGSGYFHVDPDIGFPMEAIVCQTVLSKLLGSIDTWKDKLQVGHESGYNMIHFTPIQTLGASNSAYSLSDQHGLNPLFKATHNEVKDVVESIRREWGLISICDIVLNHTANETSWLADHPDATYNLVNCPHLRPAFLFDRVIKRLATDIGTGRWVEKGIPKGEVSEQSHIEICKDLLLNVYLPQANIVELFLLNVDKVVEEFEAALKDAPVDVNETGEVKLKIIQDPMYRRNKSTVDLKLAVKIFNKSNAEVTEDKRILECVSQFKQYLGCLVARKEAEILTHLKQGVDNVCSGASYQHVDPTGPRQTAVSIREDQELVAPYFTCLNLPTLEEEFDLAFKSDGANCMAHNGWVMGDDPLSNFALPGSNVYLRRELVAWGDSVKLRYGDKPEDSPFLWDYMTKYVVLTAELFQGVRLDNCHSTPLHVATYMLDKARKVRPNLYVCAELFTGSEAKDNVFVNKLGITSLIREGMAAWDSHELGRMVYKYGGEPVGSLKWTSSTQKLVPSTAHALFMDWTHDNPSPVEKRSVEDMLPSAGLVSMAACAVGSNRGYDEFVPHHIHVVSESRSYSGWSSMSNSSGMIKVRGELTKLHQRLAREGFSEVFVDQMSRDIVAITRHNPRNRRSIVMVAHTRFFPGNEVPKQDLMLQLEGRLVEIVLQASMVSCGTLEEHIKDEKIINGLKNWSAEVLSVEEKLVEIVSDGSDGLMSVNLARLVPGSIVVLEIEPLEIYQDAFQNLRNLNSDELDIIVKNLSLLDIQFALFQCDQEGKEAGFGTYNIPGWGQLNYCGLAGVVPLLNTIRSVNDLGHPLANNLRAGDWMMDYITNRLRSCKGTVELASWLSNAFDSLKVVPRFLIPRYFDSTIMLVYESLEKQAFTMMSEFISSGSDFVKMLAMGSVIHTSAVASAPLPPLSAALSPPPAISPPTMAAGLPHFSTGFMRSWGRDTFISLRGLLLVTGRFQEARDIILGYASTLRHGLIPNLLDGGKNARFNCRDAVWWWLRAILDYIEITQDKGVILKQPVHRLFPGTDESSWTDKAVTQCLEDVVSEALQTHVNGLKFRERNAGTKIDEHMKDAGFNIEIGVDIETGFVFGGNVNNCGTWMDKMGSSAQAGNKGVPSSPRDGSAVEIVGLSYSCLRDLSNLGKDVYSHQELKGMGNLSDWADKIKQNFEEHYWIGSKAGSTKDKKPEFVNQIEIYKDSVNSGHVFTDYQMRPNYAITLAVAPDLVDPEHGWASLQNMKDRLLGPIGLATLDPKDWAYRGNYDNSCQSTDSTVAHGANYHQGPEWLWPVGFFLRALLKIGKLMGDSEYEKAVKISNDVLSRHYLHLASSPWLGLPELTNKDGAFCKDSNPIQAWSMATLLDVLWDMAV